MCLDVLGAFAETARLHNYCRPQIGDEGRLCIREGRHPVLEAALKDEPFVPNDTALGGEDGPMMIITGPNMAGKSTYIRQVALLTLLAHCGCWTGSTRRTTPPWPLICWRAKRAGCVSRMNR